MVGQRRGEAYASACGSATPLARKAGGEEQHGGGFGDGAPFPDDDVEVRFTRGHEEADPISLFHLALSSASSTLSHHASYATGTDEGVQELSG